MRLVPMVASAVALVLAAEVALADRIALLPSRGGDDPAARTQLDRDVAAGLVAEGHVLVPEQELQAALARLPAGDGADTAAAWRAVADATHADWVVVGSVEPAVQTERVELNAFFWKMGRTESVAREVNRQRSAPEVAEMLGVLVRPEGVGVGELPWERAKPQQVAVPVREPPPARVVPPAPAPPNKVHMDYMQTSEDVWPPYSAGHHGALVVVQGLSFLADRPAGASGTGAAMVLDARGAYALGDAGLEVFAGGGGNLFGPRAVWLDAGFRWMWTPSVHVVGSSRYGLGFHVGPELVAGAFFRLPGPDVTGPDGRVYASSGATRFMLGGGLDMVLNATPTLAIEGRLGDLRWIPGEDGALVLAGATLGGALRF